MKYQIFNKSTEIYHIGFLLICWRFGISCCSFICLLL